MHFFYLFRLLSTVSSRIAVILIQVPAFLMSFFPCFFLFVVGNSQSSLKMRIKLGKQSVEKAKAEMSSAVSLLNKKSVFF